MDIRKKKKKKRKIVMRNVRMITVSNTKTKWMRCSIGRLGVRRTTTKRRVLEMMLQQRWLL